MAPIAAAGDIDGSEFIVPEPGTQVESNDGLYLAYLPQAWCGATNVSGISDDWVCFGETLFQFIRNEGD
jgi:hypothetical protein